MSISVHAYLGFDLDDIEARVKQRFEELGFKISWHPEIALLSPLGDSLSVVFLKTPINLSRRANLEPLLLEFVYASEKNPSYSSEDAGHLPRGVGKHSYRLMSYISSGRSISQYLAQSLLLAILSEQTNGYWRIDWDEHVYNGSEAVSKVMKELLAITEAEFDVDTPSFVDWPPIAVLRVAAKNLKNTATKRTLLHTQPLPVKGKDLRRQIFRYLGYVVLIVWFLGLARTFLNF
jgi:hypothetical protein